MAQRPPYEGRLAEPEYAPTLLTSDEDRAAWQKRRLEKTLFLFAHFGITPGLENSWRDHAMVLAERHVPGFGPPPAPRGHPMDYHSGEKIDLAGRAHLPMLQSKVQIAQAAPANSASAHPAMGSENVLELWKLPTHA